jgi:16S rRNA (uracil1498-N3)-methyltransferase
MARRRFFVEEVHSGGAEILGDDARHLTRVLRVEVGQRYEISDNRNVFLAEIETARKELVRFRVLEPVALRQPRAGIILAAAIFKFDHFEWLVEKATELGVERILPFASSRTERGLDRAAEKRVERWRRIAQEASQQARRDRLPIVDDPLALRAVAATQCSVRVLLDEMPEAPPLVQVLPSEKKASDVVGLAVGPEGGWIEEERAIFAESGWLPASLGPQVLRAETAGIAALAVIGAEWDAAVTGARR